MATIFTDATGNHKWSDAGNWSAGKPTATVDVTVASAVTSLICNEASFCKSFDLTGTAGITFSGSSLLAVYGSFTLDSNVTWTQSGLLYLRGTGTIAIDTAGKSLASISACYIDQNISITLANTLNCGTKNLLIYNSPTITTNNYNITCGVFGDDNNSGSPTINLGSSTITCSWVAFNVSTPTINSSGAHINCDPGANSVAYKFGGAIWGDAVVGIKTYNTKISTLSGLTNFTGTLNLTKNSGTATVTFPASATSTFGAFSANGLILTSSDGAHAAVLSCPSGVNTATDCTLSWLTAQGGALWKALLSAGNTDGGHNSGWQFTAGLLTNPGMNGGLNRFCNGGLNG